VEAVAASDARLVEDCCEEKEEDDRPLGLFLLLGREGGFHADAPTIRISDCVIAWRMWMSFFCDKYIFRKTIRIQLANSTFSEISRPLLTNIGSDWITQQRIAQPGRH